ncbi:MAG: tail fiber domain-containing protein, partial [Candidatus Dojkabacteria bacterium]|nr:tail fiber domain-containing protein [Candidatus Dojkabacteria bacterium]
GNEALKSNTTGDYNIAIGNEALKSNTTGDYNIAIGIKALNSNTTGFQNIAIGYEALKQNTNSSNLIGIGDRALQNYFNPFAPNGYNIAIGASALQYCSGTKNIGIGFESLQNPGWNDENIALGYCAGKKLSGYSNIAIGNETFNNSSALSTGGYNIAIGNKALGNNTSGNTNIAIGHESLNSNTAGYQNIAIGYGSLNSNIAGYNNIAVGYNTLFSFQDGYSNIVIGAGGLKNCSLAENNIVIGPTQCQTPIQSNKKFNNNIFIGVNGFFSGTQSTISVNVVDNIVIGFRNGKFDATNSGLISSTGDYKNIIIGFDNIQYGSLGKNNNDNTNYNIILGNSNIGNGIDCEIGNGGQNIILGNFILYPSESTYTYKMTGRQNIIIGNNILSYAPNNTTFSGKNNIFIGNDFPYNSNYLTNSNRVYLNITNSPTSGGGSPVKIITSTKELIIETSSLKYKKDIEDMWDSAADKILELRPVFYRLKNDSLNHSHYGFIAEEVAQVDPRLVVWGYHEDDYEYVDVKIIKPEEKKIILNNNESLLIYNSSNQFIFINNIQDKIIKGLVEIENIDQFSLIKENLYNHLTNLISENMEIISENPESFIISDFSINEYNIKNIKLCSISEINEFLSSLNIQKIYYVTHYITNYENIGSLLFSLTNNNKIQISYRNYFYTSQKKLKDGITQSPISIDYGKFTPHLVSVVKRQRNKIQELENKINQLESTIQNINNLLQQLLSS